MIFRASNWKICLLAGFVLGAGWLAHGQTMQRGQRIIFAAPDATDTATNVSSLAPHPPALSGLADTVKMSPPSHFNFPAQPQPQLAPPLPGSTMSAVQAAQYREAADEKKNWAMMTPAEIMGVPSAEQVMGIPERDANGEIKRQTVEERYYERQMLSGKARTNGPAGASLSSDWNLPKTPETTANIFGVQPLGKPVSTDVFGNEAQGQTPAPNPSTVAQWSNPFNNPAPAVVVPQTPAQVTSAEEFQKLLQPHALMDQSVPANAAALPPRPNNPASPATTAFGTPIAPVSSSANNNIGSPIGVRPVLWQPEQKQNTSPSQNAWKPQLPPWMYSTPQPGVAPQRQF